MITIILRKTMVSYQATVVNRLKCPADREAEAASFARQKEIRQLFSESEFRVRVVKIDQPERHVDDRHLHAKLDADARSKIAEPAEGGIVDAHQIVALSFTAQENPLQPRRQAHRAADAVAAAEDIDKLRFGYNLIVIKQRAAEAAFEVRSVSQGQSRDGARA